MIWKLLVAQLLCITNAGNDFDTIKHNYELTLYKKSSKKTNVETR